MDSKDQPRKRKRPPERTFEENLRLLHCMKRLLEVWDPDQSEEERKAAMLPVMREIRKEFLERQATEGVQDYSGNEKPN